MAGLFVQISPYCEIIQQSIKLLLILKHTYFGLTAPKYLSIIRLSSHFIMSIPDEGFLFYFFFFRKASGALNLILLHLHWFYKILTTFWWGGNGCRYTATVRPQSKILFSCNWYCQNCRLYLKEIPIRCCESN